MQESRVAVVTGSSSGIGRAIAEALAAEGFDLVVHARRNVKGAEETAALVRKHQRQVLVLAADLADPAEQAKLVRQTWQWQGRVDSWINNAGVDVLTGAAAGWTFEQKLAELLRIDLVATMALSRAIGARMKAAGQGTIVNIGWDQAEVGMAGDSGELFAAVKGGVMAFTRSLARSLAPEVRVNCVAPGWIKTKWGEQASDDWQRRAQGESLLARWGTPQDVAAAVRFLVSTEAGFINGQTLDVNGGFRHA